MSAPPVTALLDEFFRTQLPITQYLSMRSHAFDGNAFSLAIDLQPSLNDKLTAFGGSLYCACVMNGWGMIYLQCRLRGINPNLVVSHAEIDYLAPVADDVIVARCRDGAGADWDAWVASVGQCGRGRKRLRSVIVSGGREAVRFSGEYAVIGIHA